MIYILKLSLKYLYFYECNSSTGYIGSHSLLTGNLSEEIGPIATFYFIIQYKWICMVEDT